MIHSINKAQPRDVLLGVVLLGRGGYSDAPLAEMARVVAAVQHGGQFQWMLAPEEQHKPYSSHVMNRISFGELHEVVHRTQSAESTA